MKRKTSISHDETIIRRLRKDPEFAAEYVKAALEDDDELPVLAREKATFGNWLTTKQQEAQNIEEALELFANKPEVATANNQLEATLVGPSAKPVWEGEVKR